MQMFIEVNSILVATGRIPIRPEVGITVEELRQLAWVGFKDLVSHTDEPLDDFVIDVQEILGSGINCGGTSDGS